MMLPRCHRINAVPPRCLSVATTNTVLPPSCRCRPQAACRCQACRHRQAARRAAAATNIAFVFIVIVVADIVVVIVAIAITTFLLIVDCCLCPSLLPPVSLLPPQWRTAAAAAALPPRCLPPLSCHRRCATAAAAMLLPRCRHAYLGAAAAADVTLLSSCPCGHQARRRHCHAATSQLRCCCSGGCAFRTAKRASCESSCVNDYSTLWYYLHFRQVLVIDDSNCKSGFVSPSVALNDTMEQVY